MDESRKPLAWVEGRRRMPLSGITVAWRGTPGLDDWALYIADGTPSRRSILTDGVPERKVRALLTRLRALPRREIEKLAKG